MSSLRATGPQNKLVSRGTVDSVSIAKLPEESPYKAREASVLRFNVQLRGSGSTAPSKGFILADFSQFSTNWLRKELPVDFGYIPALYLCRFQALNIVRHLLEYRDAVDYQGQAAHEEGDNLGLEFVRGRLGFYPLPPDCEGLTSKRTGRLIVDEVISSCTVGLLACAACFCLMSFRYIDKGIWLVFTGDQHDA